MEWHDWWRLLIAAVSAACMFGLLHRYMQHSKQWNDKTKDYWYALFMWCLAGAAIAIEGVLRDSNFGGRLVFLTAASAVTLRGLLQHGPWGGDDS